MADFDTKAVGAAVEKALIYAILTGKGLNDEGVSGEFADAIGVIVEHGPGAVHAALSGWSGLTLHGFTETQGPPPPGGFWFLEVEDVKAGVTVSSDVCDPATRDAMRIVTCLGNKDHAMIAAIVKTAWDGDDDTLVDLLLTSVRVAAKVAIHLKEARDAG